MDNNTKNLTKSYEILKNDPRYNELPQEIKSAVENPNLLKLALIASEAYQTPSTQPLVQEQPEPLDEPTLKAYAYQFALETGLIMVIGGYLIMFAVYLIIKLFGFNDLFILAEIGMHAVTVMAISLTIANVYKLIR